MLKVDVSVFVRVHVGLKIEILDLTLYQPMTPMRHGFSIRQWEFIWGF